MNGSCCCESESCILPVEPQHFAENENQDHADEYPGLQHVRPDALVADDADAVACRESGEPDRQPAREMHESAGETSVTHTWLVIRLWVQATYLNKL